MAGNEIIIQQLGDEFPSNLKRHIENLLELIDDNATVPFIARYRKERTGNMNEEEIRQIQERYAYFKELLDRKEKVLKRISDLGKLTDELQKTIVNCFDRQTLEDLYLPYRPKRKTKASVAREKGLEPLAQKIFAQEGIFNLAAEAQPFVNVELGVNTPEEALEGAGHIIAEWISDSAECRHFIRNLVLDKGILFAKALKDKEQERSKFEDYYDYREPLKCIPSHRYLAIRRGSREGILRNTIEYPEDEALFFLENHFLHTPCPESGAFLQTCIKDALHRLIFPAIELEVRTILKEEADLSAINVFAKNLRALLMAPPAGYKRVLGVDPGLRTGCKVAAIDETGKFLLYETIYPHTSGEAKKQESEAVLKRVIEEVKPEVIVIGNGTASRETQQFVTGACSGLPTKIPVLIVSEAGASVYSASDIARAEFPELDVTIRGAVSIARRFQDPLAELVKIEARSIGVGQYQHDINPNRLKLELDAVVESCVNQVGVDLGTASLSLLSYVSGIGPSLSSAIIEHRNQHGAFKTKTELLEVAGIGPKTFEQAAGFLRIRDGVNPLDNTGIHPENHRLVEDMAHKARVPLPALLGNRALLDRLKLDEFVTETIGLPTLNDIYQDLLKPGRDPRRTFQFPSFREDITSIEQLTPGMILDGVVTNTTNFGVFVDVGVHVDGLVHISELAQGFITDPSSVVTLGETIRLKVLEVDLARKRIALSCKQVGNAKRSAPQKPVEKPKPVKPKQDDSLSVTDFVKLRDHFKGR